MATRTLASAQDELVAAYAARRRILDTGQYVAVDGSSVNQATLQSLNDTILVLEREVERLTAESSGNYGAFRYTLADFSQC